MQLSLELSLLFGAVVVVVVVVVGLVVVDVIFVGPIILFSIWELLVLYEKHDRDVIWQGSL